jgi:hypothetical protein
MNVWRLNDLDRGGHEQDCPLIVVGCPGAVPMAGGS